MCQLFVIKLSEMIMHEDQCIGVQVCASLSKMLHSDQR